MQSFRLSKRRQLLGKSINDQYPSGINSKEVVQLTYSLTSKTGSNQGDFNSPPEDPHDPFLITNSIINWFHH